MRRLKWVIGAMFVVVVLFQCFEVLNSGPQSSLLGSLRIQFGPKNVSQIDDSSFVARIGGGGGGGGGSKGGGSSQSSETNLTTDSPQYREGNGSYTYNHASGNPLSNGTSTTGWEKDKKMEPVPEQIFTPSFIGERSTTPPAMSPAYSPLDKKTSTAENGNGRFASPPLPPVNEPLVALPSETTKKIESVQKPEKINTKKEDTKALPKVVSISQMNDLLRQSRLYYRSMKPIWSSAADEDLISAKSQIENAPVFDDLELYAPLYHNVSMFHRSYELMEQILKVYVYKEGKGPVFHRPPLKGIYASEGWFMKHVEANNKFVTKDPSKAHLFYIPFSSRQLEETLYVKNSHSMDNLIAFLNDYLNTIRGKYPYWNRTAGADHFVVACHDWALFETGKIMPNSIRALCNSDVKEGYKFGKDVALAETNVRSPKNVLAGIGGKPPSQRDTLAFFAGRMHGYLRPVLLEHWENKDPDIKVFGRLPRQKKGNNYIQYMKSSKYCICARGYEVNSPRVVESIFFECVPVIISDNFVPPFFEILNWKSFAVFIPEKDVPNLKTILLSISEKRYIEMQRRVKKVQQHFLWHAKPEKYDIFHMILHSIWFNRVFTFQS